MTGEPPSRPTWAARVEAGLQRHWWRARPSILMRLLWPLSRLYGALAAVARSQAVPQPGPAVPVLVVGNLVAGGAGKTPAVIALVQAFQAAGRRPGVISRGHGRQGDSVLAVTADATGPARRRRALAHPAPHWRAGLGGSRAQRGRVGTVRGAP